MGSSRGISRVFLGVIDKPLPLPLPARLTTEQSAVKAVIELKTQLSYAVAETKPEKNSGLQGFEP